MRPDRRLFALRTRVDSLPSNQRHLPDIDS
jgi:hypothetical protein